MMLLKVRENGCDNLLIDTYKIIPTFLQPAVAVSMALVEIKIQKIYFAK